MNEWKRHFDKGVTEFLNKNWNQALIFFITALNIDNFQPQVWLMAGLTYFKLNNIRSSINAAQACLDFQPENPFARFCTDLFNDRLLNSFFNKTGKILELYDNEIVYTTEDEYDVKRGTDNDPERFKKELAEFWDGYMQGEWNTLKSEYGYTDDMIMNSIQHNKFMMSVNFNGIELGRDDRILEIGTGSGRILHGLAKLGLIENVVASDVAVEEIKGVRKCFKKIHKRNHLGFVGLLADKLPFKKNSFSVVFMMDVVEHLYHHEFVNLLRSVKDILMPHGKIYLQTPDGLRYSGAIHRLDNGSVNIPEMNGNWQHVAEKSMGYLKKTLNENGFTVSVLNRMRNYIKAEIQLDLQ